jgi:hypothetical protein
LVRLKVHDVLTVRTRDIALLCHEIIRIGTDGITGHGPVAAANALSLPRFGSSTTNFSRPICTLQADCSKYSESATDATLVEPAVSLA